MAAPLDLEALKERQARRARRMEAELEALIAEVERLRAERGALREACELTVREMERYYRGGGAPDSAILRASKRALLAKVEGEISQ